MKFFLKLVVGRSTYYHKGICIHTCMDKMQKSVGSLVVEKLELIPKVELKNLFLVSS